MSLLNITNDGLPNVLVVLHAYLLRASQRAVTKAALLEAVAPAALVEDGGDMARQTLNSWLAIGLFREENDCIVTDRYPHSVRSASAPDLLTFTRRSASRAAFSALANPELWGMKGAADLTRALSWMMLQDAYRHGFSDFERLESEQIADTDRLLFRNSTRRTGLVFWSRFLGFSRVPYADIDPTVALRDALPEIIEQGETLSADAFLDRVAVALPVIDRGRWQTEVLASVAPPPYLRSSGHVSPALSRALLNLRASQELLLLRTSDTGSFMVLTGTHGARADLTFQQVSRPRGSAQ